MKHADGLRHLPSVAGFVLLFAIGAAMQSQAMRGAELGATYILILGLEAAFAFGLGIIMFGETATWMKCLAVLTIVVGIVLLDWQSTPG